MQEQLTKLAIRQRLLASGFDDWLGERLSIRDERGDITPRMVGAALMAGTAIAVLGIIRTRLTTRANTLNLGN